MWVSVESALIHQAVENILFAQQMNELELALSGFAGIGLLSKSTVFSILDKHLQFGFCSIAELLGRHWHSRRVYDLFGRGPAEYYDKKHPIHSGLRFDKKNTNAGGRMLATDRLFQQWEFIRTDYSYSSLHPS